MKFIKSFIKSIFFAVYTPDFASVHSTVKISSPYWPMTEIKINNDTSLYTKVDRHKNCITYACGLIKAAALLELSYYL